MVAGNTLLRLIGLAPDTYFFVFLALLCLAFIGGRLLIISKHLRTLEKLLHFGSATPVHSAQHSATSPAVSSDTPKPRRVNSGRTYPHRRAARLASRKLEAAQRS